MARVSLGRVIAVFFVSVATVLALALIGLYLAMPVKVQAQSMCVPAERFVEALAMQEGVERAVLLTKDETATYLEASAGVTNTPADAQMIVYRMANEAGIVPIVNGLACPEFGVIRVPLPAHRIGMEAAFGVAL
jgi:hypothetical protein